VNDAGFLLHLSGHGDIARTQNDRPEAFECLRPDDDVGDGRFVLDGHEDDAIGRARPLADGDEAGDGGAFAGPACAQVLVAGDAAPGEVGAQERCRMRAQRQFEEAVVVDHLFAERHERKRDRRFTRG
jgi:hypothetical protein